MRCKENLRGVGVGRSGGYVGPGRPPLPARSDGGGGGGRERGRELFLVPAVLF